MTCKELGRIMEGRTRLYQPNRAGLQPVSYCPRCGRAGVDAGELCLECTAEISTADRANPKPLEGAP